MRLSFGLSWVIEGTERVGEQAQRHNCYQSFAYQSPGAHLPPSCLAAIGNIGVVARTYLDFPRARARDRVRVAAAEAVHARHLRVRVGLLGGLAGAEKRCQQAQWQQLAHQLTNQPHGIHCKIGGIR